jgi:uroporphyrinogen decarboxylase
MHPRVERLPDPEPDYGRFLKVLRRERPDRVPLIELAVASETADVLLDEPPVHADDADAALLASIQRSVRMHHRLGYDVVKVSAPIPWDVQRLAGADPTASGGGARQWTDEHSGPIGSMADFESFRWPRAEEVDFRPLEAATAVLPEGMKLIGFSGGVLEFAMDLIGMERLMLSLRREPALVAAVIERVGRTILGVFEAYCRMDSVCALWLGDDLGHKHGLLVSPKFLAEQVLPWYRRFADLAHRHGRPFMLHTCGNTADIMPKLVDEVGIDAKHSFEDGILPVERFIDQWGDRVAVLGGVDVHLLSVGEDADIRGRTLQILEHAAPRGGYACGSGNSIPRYVPPEHFLTMIETVAEFNGRR